VTWSFRTRISFAVSLLEVVDLHVSFLTADGLVRAVRGASFSVDAGRTLAIVGESGSGKSVACLAVIGLSEADQVSGRIIFDGRDILAMEEGARRGLRGREIAIVFQDPLSSLHPLYKVGWQVAETVRAHEKVSRRAATARAVELLGMVGIPEPAARAEAYPYQYSGGMRQRAMIAMALTLSPKLLIADEPTSALDVTVQAQVIELIAGLQAELGMGVVLVTHDLGIVAGIADDVAVMYAGRVVEQAERRLLYYETAHPYTQGLLASLPARSAGQSRLAQIAGQPPSPLSLPAGCPFGPRCPFAHDHCFVEEPPLIYLHRRRAHAAACWMLRANGREWAGPDSHIRNAPSP
jgi:peptide/nickel transport system ATP-binding protein